MKRSWDPLSFAFQIKAKLLCFYICLLDVIVELHPMDEECSMTLLFWKWKWNFCAINAYLLKDVYFVYVVEAFITLHWNA